MTCAKFELVIVWFLFSVATNFQTGFPASEDDLVVIDSGSGYVKAGFAGDKLPRIVIPDVVATAVRNLSGKIITQTFVGESARDKRWIIPQVFPVNYGYMTNSEAMLEVWQYVLERELKVDPLSTSVVLTRSPLTPVETSQLMRDAIGKIGIEKTHLVDTSLMTLFYTGRTTGLVIESGHEATFVVPVVDGVQIASAMIYLKLGGQDVTLYLANLMGHSHSDGIRSNAMADLATQFKETQCYVALNYDTEPPSQQVIDWAWGEKIELDTIPFQAPELLFRPHLNEIDSLGISEAVFASIEKCDQSMEQELVSNIVLGGGNTMFPGMAERIEADVNSWSDYKAKVVALSDREFSAFIGASQGIQGQ